MIEGFSNDSPVLKQGPACQMTTAETPVKRKGGRSKEQDLARGIPQSVIDKFNLMTPKHETEK